MPFPIPFLPMMGIAILIAAIIPAILKVCSRDEKVEDRRTQSLRAEMNFSCVDPYSDVPEVLSGSETLSTLVPTLKVIVG